MIIDENGLSSAHNILSKGHHFYEIWSYEIEQALRKS